MTRDERGLFVSAPRLPFAPLVAMFGEVVSPRTNDGDDPRREGSCQPATVGALAELLGVSRRTLARWRREGVPVLQADRVAVRLGLHPASVWGRAWWTIEEAVA